MRNFFLYVTLFIFLIYCISKCSSCASEPVSSGYDHSHDVKIKDPSTFTKAEKDSVAYDLNLQAAAKKRFEKTKVGKLQKKHPSWTIDECNKVIAKEIWIGMEYDMLVSERGRPHTINKSNYGRGLQYQFCWEGYSSNYFYSEDDLIITSYN